MSDVARSPARLSAWACLALGLNGIVGSGIFLAPGKLAALAGGASPFAFLACGLLCLLVAACFAEAASRFGRSGGAALYAAEAFGQEVGFGVGWLTLLSGLLGYAAVVRALAERLAPGPGAAVGAVAVTVVLLLMAANLAGLAMGAGLSTLLTVLKLVPLVGLAALGLFQPPLETPLPLLPQGPEGFARAIGVAVFACSGFEFVTVPAGDAADARHDVPRAVLGSLAAATALYVGVQFVLVRSLVGLAGAEAPLDLAGAAWLGPQGGSVVAGLATLSMAGFAASSALVDPRMLAALAERGDLPAWLGLREEDVPRRAIVAVALAAAPFVALGSVDSLIDLATLSLFAQYVPTVLAVPVLRRRNRETAALTLPGGWLIPGAALLGLATLAIASAPSGSELLAALVALGMGFVLRRTARRL